ncbi:MAG: ABC transporter ATP-binding protein [Coriobacteriia bacterium]|nr:ABC transporter ATP-binding protein [Coriobacteriia bacterium]
MTKLLKNFKPYLGVIIVIIFLTIGQVRATLELPNQMSEIVDVGIVQKGITNPVTQGAGTAATQLSYILNKGALMLLITVLYMICAVAAGYLASKVSAGVARDLRAKVFSRVEAFSLADIDKFSIASLIIRSTNDIAQVQQMSFMLLRIALIAPFMAIGAILMTLKADGQLTWIIGVAIPLLAILVGITARFAMPLFRSVQKKSDRLNQVAREGLTGVRVIRAFNRQDLQRERFNATNTELTATTLRVNKLMTTILPIMMFIIQAVSVAIIWFGAKLIDTGGLQIGSLMAFLQYAMQILTAVMMLSMILIMLPRASVSAERINEVLETDPTIFDPENPRIPGNDAKVEFKDVSYAFKGADEPALSNISFTATAGTTTAIIGSTGAGKSTLINLIERLYQATSGTITVNDVPVGDVSQEELHNRLGYAPQTAVLFSGTIADNLLIGNENATEEDMWTALEVAQAKAFVEELPEKLDSYVSQGGKNFSGGQKQRLAIARAIIRKPDVYLFDDTFSALDLTTDAKLRAALEPITKEAVVIMVAQRISTITHADQIIVIDEGRIAGVGTHEELLATNEVYQEIAHSQLSEEEMSR